MKSKSTGYNIIIIGAGGHGSELYSYILDLTSEGKKLKLIGFVDEKKTPGLWKDTRILGDFSDLGKFLRLHPRSKFYYITAVGDNRIRQHFVKKLESLGAQNLLPWTLQHPDAIMGWKVEIGPGTCLAPRSIVTTHTQIGRHCILNVNTSVSHDSVIGDFVNINPGAIICGSVKIGQGSYIGSGAIIIDKVTIGEWTVIGAGSVVTKDIPANVVAIGVPAQIIRKNTL